MCYVYVLCVYIYIYTHTHEAPRERRLPHEGVAEKADAHLSSLTLTLMYHIVNKRSIS